MCQGAMTMNMQRSVAQKGVTCRSSSGMARLHGKPKLGFDFHDARIFFASNYYSSILCNIMQLALYVILAGDSHAQWFNRIKSSTFCLWASFALHK